MSAFPSSPAPASCTLRSITPTLVSAGQSLKRQVRTRGGQRWAAMLSWGIWDAANMLPIEAFVLALDGQYATFTWVHPSLAPRGSWAGGAPQVNGASQTGSSIALKGFTAGQTGVVKAGDLLKFSDTKVYMATADANSDGSGHATVSIKPKLIVSPADGEAVVYTSVPFTMCLSADQVDLPATVPSFYSMSLNFMEAY